MTDLADRTTGSGLVEKTRPFTPEHAPPERRPPVTPHTTAPWPRNAKLLIAVLAVVALLGGLGTIIGFTSGDDQSANEAELQTTVDTLTTERDGLAGQVTGLQTTIGTMTTERDSLVQQLTDLQADIDATDAERDVLEVDLATLESTNEAILAERDDLVAQLGDLELTTNDVITVRDDLVAQLDALEASSADVIAERDDLLDQLAVLDTRITTLTDRRDDLTDRVTALEASLTAQTSLAVSAIAERNALQNLFPIEFDAAIDVDDVVGTYDIEYTQAFCDGFATCGTVPTIDEITIRKTADDRLEMVMPDNPTAGMMMVDGVLYAVFHSTNMTPACGAPTQLARVTMTVFPQGLTIADDGTAAVTALGAGMTMQAEPSAGCPAGLTFYAAQLTPQA